MNPHQTGEHPVAALPTLSKRTVIGLDLESLVVLFVAAVGAGGTWFSVRSSVADMQARVGSSEARLSKLEDAKAANDLHFQKLDDDLRHLVETVDRIDQNVQQIQKAK